MGEPQPGDIADPTHVKTTNILLEADQVGLVGEWAVYNTVTDFWAMAQIVLEDALPTGAVQLQQDINSTGLADGVANAAAFGNGSWVYAFIAADVLPNSEVFLIVFDTTGSGPNAIGFSNSVTFQGDVVVATNIGTFTSDIAVNFRVGEKITFISTIITETTPLVVLSVSNNGLVVTFATTSGDNASTEATATNSAIENGGDAKFIKRSGDTFAQKGVKNEIGVFSMTGARL